MLSIRRLGEATEAASRVALVLPGAGYTAQAPLLYWTTRALADAGWDVWGIDWHSDIDESARRDLFGFVHAALVRAERVLPKPPELVVAKSLGTYGLPYFTDRDVRAAWLTPILTDSNVAGALAAVTRGAHLAIGGSGDPAWRPELVAASQARLVTVDDAGHSLEAASAEWREASQRQLDIIDQVVAHLLDA
jgi:hypothetical protein